MSCSTDFPKQEIETENLSGYIEGGNATGVYDKAGLRIDKDSISMTDWPVSRLVDNLNRILDTTITDQTKTRDFYTIKIANAGELQQIEFCDSLVIVLSEHRLIQ